MFNTALDSDGVSVLKLLFLPGRTCCSSSAQNVGLCQNYRQNNEIRISHCSVATARLDADLPGVGKVSSLVSVPTVLAQLLAFTELN